MSDPVHRHRVVYAQLVHPTLLDHDEAFVATMRRLVEQHRSFYPDALPSTMLLRVTVEADAPTFAQDAGTTTETVAPEPLTQREQVEQVFGPISDTQWQWLKAFVAGQQVSLDETPRGGFRGGKVPPPHERVDLRAVTRRHEHAALAGQPHSHAADGLRVPVGTVTERDFTKGPCRCTNVAEQHTVEQSHIYAQQDVDRLMRHFTGQEDTDGPQT